MKFSIYWSLVYGVLLRKNDLTDYRFVFDGSEVFFDKLDDDDFYVDLLEGKDKSSIIRLFEIDDSVTVSILGASVKEFEFIACNPNTSNLWTSVEDVDLQTQAEVKKYLKSINCPIAPRIHIVHWVNL